ncbi:hypothetical protein B0T18DRAFT_367367 [Schizothecium vesticola]|uniref:Uncharacterized protein n=1 Tax=Schizothecium vesticola TaxID=314040 RepID=A0AA40EUB7_9PEZI|nr:hypothetical protein B0T18DRAFT_367367 [Schizothecium vesticola]
MLRHGLADVYVAPNESAYHLQKAFTITTGNGTLWAIAFSDRTGRYLNTSLTVIFTLMFTWLWGLIAAATIYFVPHQFSRRRLVALVALRNSQDPWSAFMAFANFTTESMGLFLSTWQDTGFGLLLVLLALIVILTRVIMSIILPPSLQIGNVAPVNESVTFYPRTALLDSSSSVYRAFRAGPSLRALSSAQVSGDAIRGRVKVQRDPSVTTQDPSQPMYGLTYSYDISGVELGLETAGDLVLSVNGACRTEYGWLNVGASNDTTKVIDIFGDPTNNFTTHTEDRFLKIVPIAAFTLASEVPYKEQLTAGNVSYAVIATLSLHRSTTENKEDPWYRTEDHLSRPGETPRTNYRIQPGRPVLSCWHHDRWSAGGTSVNGGKSIDKLTTLGTPQVLKDVLATALLQPPPYTVGTDTGSSALISVLQSRFSQTGVIDAGAGSIHQDMERLVIGGFILTLNRLSDMAMYTPSGVEMVESNLFYSKKDKDTAKPQLPLDGRGDFLVSSPNIATFNLAGLIATGAVVLFLLVGQLVLTAKLNFYTSNKVLANSRTRGSHELDPHQEADRFNDDRWARFRAFSAVHLLRNTYEDGTGKPEDDWRCSENLPTPTDQKMLRLVRCHHGDEDCAGHIATDPELLLGIRAASRASISGGPGKRVRTSITSLPENASFSAFDPATGRTRTLSHAGSLPGYTPVGQFEMRPIDEVNNPRASITSSNAANTVSETSYTSPSAYGNMAPAGGATPYSFTATPPTSYFSPAPSAGFGPGPYFSAASSPPAHGGGRYVNNSAVLTPYHDEDDIAISTSASELRNANSAPLLSTMAQTGGAPTPPQSSSQQRGYFNARMS